MSTTVGFVSAAFLLLAGYFAGNGTLVLCGGLTGLVAALTCGEDD